MTAGLCRVPDCLNPPHEHGRGLCWSHFRRQGRSGGEPERVQGKLRPWALVMEAAINLAECDTDDDKAFACAQAKLRWAVESWMRRPRAEEMQAGGERKGSTGSAGEASDRDY